MSCADQDMPHKAPTVKITDAAIVYAPIIGMVSCFSR